MADIFIGNIKGPQGDTGPQGNQGEKGDAATISVGSVTTTQYGQTAKVTNSGTVHDAVFDFVIPQGRPGEQVTKIDNLTIDAITEPSTQFPVPAVGDNGSTLFGKISKWFSDMTALVATKFNASNVVNNLTTTSSGYALDARQGKALSDVLATVNTKVTNRLKRQTAGSGTLDTSYWEESTLRYDIIDNLCFVGIAGHLKPITGYKETVIGSGFPKSTGANFNISCVIDNAGKVPGIFSVNALGQLSIITRDPITGTSTTVTGRLVYVIQDNYAP